MSEPPYTEGFGDSAHPRVPEDDVALFRRLRPLCGKLVVVVYSGRPVDLIGLDSEADALVAAWLPGTEAGPGIWDVLCGVHGFGGKLSFTWPRGFEGYQGQGGLVDGMILYERGYGLMYG